MKILSRLVLFSALLTLTVAGQEKTTSRAYTLQECIDIALRNNYDLRMQNNTLERAEYDTWKAWQGFMPRADLRANGTYFESGDARFLTNVQVPNPDNPGEFIIVQQEVVQPGQKRHNYSSSFSLNWTIFDGMATWYGVKASRWSENASRRELQAQINSTVQQVRGAYLDLLKFQKLVEVSKLAVERSQEQLKKQVLAFRIGSATRLDTLKSYVTYNTDRIELITNKNGVKQSMYALNIVLARDPGTPIRVADLDVNRLPVLEDYTVLEDFIRQRNPTLLANEARREAANDTRKGRISPFLPSFGFGYTYSRTHETAGKVFLFEDWDQFWNYNVGFSASWNLFNGFGDHINYQQALIDERNSELNLLKIEADLLRSLRVAYDNYKDALVIVDINKVNLESAREDYRLASERKTVGSATILEVIDSQVSLTRAEQTLVEAYYSALQARNQIDELIGTEYKQKMGGANE
jgi:outer membrane protein